MTNEQKRMLRVVAAYNDITEEQAEKAIVADFLTWLLNDSTKELQDLKLNIKKPEQLPRPLPDFDPAIETPEKVRKKPGRKPKTVEQWASDTAREVRQAEKMSKDEFVEYFGGKG